MSNTLSTQDKHAAAATVVTNDQVVEANSPDANTAMGDHVAPLTTGDMSNGQNLDSCSSPERSNESAEVAESDVAQLRKLCESCRQLTFDMIHFSTKLWHYVLIGLRSQQPPSDSAASNMLRNREITSLPLAEFHHIMSTLNLDMRVTLNLRELSDHYRNLTTTINNTLEEAEEVMSNVTPGFETDASHQSKTVVTKLKNHAATFHSNIRGILNWL